MTVWGAETGFAVSQGGLGELADLQVVPQPGVGVPKAAAAAALHESEGGGQQQDENAGRGGKPGDLPLVARPQDFREAGGVRGGDGRIAGSDSGERAIGGDGIERGAKVADGVRERGAGHQNVVEPCVRVYRAQTDRRTCGSVVEQQLGQVHGRDDACARGPGTDGIRYARGRLDGHQPAGSEGSGEFVAGSAGNGEKPTLQNVFQTGRIPQGTVAGNQDRETGGPPRFGNKEFAAALRGVDSGNDIDPASPQTFIVGLDIADDHPLQGDAGAAGGRFHGLHHEAPRLAESVLVSHRPGCGLTDPQYGLWLLFAGGSQKQGHQNQRKCRTAARPHSGVSAVT